jgi:hypothetical protein
MRWGHLFASHVGRWCGSVAELRERKTIDEEVVERLMLSAGLVLAVSVIAAVTLVAIFGRGGRGWSALLIGAGGVAYAIARYPERILLIVFPLSVLFVLVGAIAVTKQYLYRGGSKERHG